MTCDVRILDAPAVSQQLALISKRKLYTWRARLARGARWTTAPGERGSPAWWSVTAEATVVMDVRISNSVF